MGSLSTRSIARIVTGIYAVALVIGIGKVQPGCVKVLVWASQEKSELLAELADRYEATTRPSEDLRCVDIDVVQKASGDAEDALKGAGVAGGPGLPDAWSPAASTWLRLLERERELAGASAIVPTAAPPLMHSPLVVAMPEPMAKVLGWPNWDPSWADIFALARDPETWSSRGHPDWGRFKLAKTNPLISTSGLHTLVSTYLVSGGSSIADPRVQSYMKDVETSVLHYGKTVSSFLVNLWEADNRHEELTYLSAIALEEQQIWQYNRGNPEFLRKANRLPPNTRLVALYPSDGTIYADHPFAVMPWAEGPKQRAAAKFLAYLRSDAIQREFMDNAFRSANFETGGPIRNDTAFNPDKPVRTFPPQSPTVLEQIQSSWSGYRKRARVLVIMDTSESMGQTGAGAATKLDLATDAWTNALPSFVDEDEVGLWALAGTERRHVLDVGAMKDQRAQFTSALAALRPSGKGKALYAAIAEGVAAMRQRFARDRINAIVVLSDGKNDDVSNSDVNGLLRSLRGQAEDDRVRVFTIALGPSADVDALRSIATAGRGAFYGEASDPSVIKRVVQDAVSSF